MKGKMSIREAAKLRNEYSKSGRQLSQELIYMSTISGFFFSYLIDIHLSNIYRTYMKKIKGEVLKTKSSQPVL